MVELAGIEPILRTPFSMLRGKTEDLASTCKNSLDPEAMHAALEAFELAWASITALPDFYDPNLARDALSKRIIKAAVENGERGPNRLKAYALAGFNR